MCSTYSSCTFCSNLSLLWYPFNYSMASFTIALTHPSSRKVNASTYPISSCCSTKILKSPERLASSCGFVIEMCGTTQVDHMEKQATVSTRFLFLWSSLCRTTYVIDKQFRNFVLRVLLEILQSLSSWSFFLAFLRYTFVSNQWPHRTVIVNH